jgi:hypothetical protein
VKRGQKSGYRLTGFSSFLQKRTGVGNEAGLNADDRPLIVMVCVEQGFEYFGSSSKTRLLSDQPSGASFFTDRLLSQRYSFPVCPLWLCSART